MSPSPSVPSQVPRKRSKAEADPDDSADVDIMADQVAAGEIAMRDQFLHKLRCPKCKESKKSSKLNSVGIKPDGSGRSCLHVSCVNCTFLGTFSAVLDQQLGESPSPGKSRYNPNSPPLPPIQINLDEPKADILRSVAAQLEKLTAQVTALEQKGATPISTGLSSENAALRELVEKQAAEIDQLTQRLSKLENAAVDPIATPPAIRSNNLSQPKTPQTQPTPKTRTSSPPKQKRLSYADKLRAAVSNESSTPEEKFRAFSTLAPPKEGSTPRKHTERLEKVYIRTGLRKAFLDQPLSNVRIMLNSLKAPFVEEISLIGKNASLAECYVDADLAVKFQTATKVKNLLLENFDVFAPPPHRTDLIREDMVPMVIARRTRVVKAARYKLVRDAALDDLSPEVVEKVLARAVPSRKGKKVDADGFQTVNHSEKPISAAEDVMDQE